MNSLRDVLASDRVLLYDGGFGTELFARDVDLPNSSLANELHPDAVRQVTVTWVGSAPSPISFGLTSRVID